MQRNKGIQNISEINDLVVDDFHVLNSLRRVLDRFNMSTITRVFSSVKSKGISANELFKVLFMFPFLSIDNVSCLFSSGLHQEIVGKKDTYYRFLNNPNIPWRKVMKSFSNQFFKQAKFYGSDDSTNLTKCLIVDDSIIPKSGKKIEFIGKVFDHCSHLYSLGIKFLLLGYWDGKSFIPMDFSLHFEPGKTGKRGLSTKDLNKQYSKDRSEFCCSHKRIEELGVSKIEVALQMIKRVASRKLPINYVLADSWFVSEKFIKGIVNLKLNMIGLMKSNRMVNLGSKSLKLNKLPELKRSKIVNCKKYKCQYIPLQATYKDVTIKVFMVRMNGQSTWKTLVTTNTNLSFINTIKLYQIRWSIEVFFKDVKQHLNLLGCQSNDFDAHISHYSLVCMEFTALSLIKRVEGYETIGNLLLKLKDSLIQQTIIKKIWKLILQLYNDFLIDFGVDLDLFIRKIINEDLWRKRINRFADFLLKDQLNQIPTTQ